MGGAIQTKEISIFKKGFQKNNIGIEVRFSFFEVANLTIGTQKGLI